ncbi:MAG: YbhB/YbcL family Raf kinase inhibitor-like protein [Magnetospirillum sp.]|nr:YbhB/YbcL family Raf kinase inhibitor-like protein [Magnetospirillum sp.]
MRITSPAFAPDGNIPVAYTCDGANLSPPLEWSGEPEGTRSFVVFCEDPDAPGRTFHHWFAFDIPADRHRLEEGEGTRRSARGVHHALNDFGEAAYGGPCPPRGHGIHHYHFHVCALSADHLPVASVASFEEARAAAQPYVLDEAELVGRYARRH